MSDSSDLLAISNILNDITNLTDFDSNAGYAVPEIYENVIEGFDVIRSGLDDIQDIISQLTDVGTALSDLSTGLNNESTARLENDDLLQANIDLLTQRIDNLLYDPIPDTDVLNGSRLYLTDFVEVFSTDQVDGLNQKFAFFTNALSGKLSDISVGAGTGLTIDKSNPAFPTITQNKPFWNNIQSKPSTYPPESHSHSQGDIIGLAGSLNNKENLSNKGIPNGYASLDGSGKIPASQINSFALALQIVNTISDRNALSPTGNLPVFVKNATGDPSVSSGGALYLYELATTSWIKLTEYESLDIIQAWSNITGKPSVFTADLNTVATGLTDTSGTMSASDSILTLFGKIKKFISDISTTGDGWEVGDIKDTMRDQTSGRWLYLRGNTIGDGSSNATELAHNDALNLFHFLWENFPTLTVRNSSGTIVSRGATATDDWVAHRTIQLFDFRGRFRRHRGVSSNGTKANGTAYDGGNIGDYGDDKFQKHKHEILGVTTDDAAGGGGTQYWRQIGGSRETGSPIADGAGTPRTGDETNPTYISVNSWIRY